MPGVQILPSPRVNPYAYDNSKAVMSIMEILGKGEVARRRDFMTKNILEAISRGEGREGISSAAMMEPGFSSGIPGVIQRIASPFADQAPGIDDIIAGRGIESAMRDPLEIEAMQADIDFTRARTESYRQPRTDRVEVPLSEPQIAGYGEAMDVRLEKAKRHWVKRPFRINYPESELFRQWKIFAGIHKFKNDTQKEQIWNTWKNKVKNRAAEGWFGKETDWDPTDPKWREAIGLTTETEETRGFSEAGYKVGDTVTQKGRKYRITGFDDDGTPLGELIP